LLLRWTAVALRPDDASAEYFAKHGNRRGYEIVHSIEFPIQGMILKGMTDP
jgi:hypothetical protein